MAKSSRKTSYRVLMVTTEAVPFAKSGGLADSVSALARELDRAGHDVRIIMPRYYEIRREQLFRYPSVFPVEVASRRYECALYEGRLPESEVIVYFLDYEELYGRSGIYGTAEGAFADNLRRFALLSHAACTIGERMGWTPQIMHAHDWPGSLVPTLSKKYRGSEVSPATILSLHNVGYQGVFPVEMFPETGLAWSELAGSGLLHYDRINMLKCGILSSDFVTTVSPTYASEIQTPLYGFSLDSVLSARSGDLSGIQNGVDYTLWNPEKDVHLEVNYTAETIALKERNKSALQREIGLPVESNVPLFGIISRLASQKGFEELIAPGFGALPTLLTELPLQVVVLGTGDPGYESELAHLSARFENLRVALTFHDGLAHRIEAGADFLLMPSRYEPCGLNQLYSLRYGTIPVVTRTGGLADTIRDISEEEGNGIVIERACPQAISEGVQRAVELWSGQRNRMLAIQQSAMRERHTWESAARKYLQAYRKAMKRSASASGV